MTTRTALIVRGGSDGYDPVGTIYLSESFLELHQFTIDVHE